MSVRRTLLARWSRRDRLAVLVVAVAVAFLTGATLVVLAIGSSTTAIAAGYGMNASVTAHASVGAAQGAAGPAGVVVPVASVETANGTATVVGVPSNASVGGVDLRPGDGTTLGSLDRARDLSLQGSAGTVTVRAVPRGRSPFPADWLVTDPGTVERLGAGSAFAIAPTSGVPARGVPIQGVLAFFVAGTRSALATLAVAAGVGATLVGVTVYSVTRMTVRDRLREVFVLRAVGSTRWRVRRLFLERGLLLLGVGVALGYAVGVVVTTVAVNLAVTLGLPTSLSIEVSGAAIRYLLPAYAGVVVVGGVATLLAVQPELGKPPSRIRESDTDVRLGGVGPRLLSGWTSVPTAATLAAFVTFLLVVAGMASVAGPLAAADGATITEPGSPHPIASRVPASYAEPLRERGIAASPEILLFLVRDGQPYSARGANYSAFTRVTDARLVAGERPSGPDEAVIGADLADTLDVDVGDTLLLGGSTAPAVARVTVVGSFAAAGPSDDQLVVSLPTARHLQRIGDADVQFIRAERLPEAPPRAGSARVTDLAVPDTVAAGESFDVRVTLRNDALAGRTVNRTVRVGGEWRTVDVALPATAERTVSERFVVREPGRTAVVAGDLRRNLTVLAPDAIRLSALPDRAPPGSRPLVRVRDARGTPVADVTVAVGNWTGTTNDDGAVRVPLGEPGSYRVTATRGNRSVAESLTVTRSATRRLQAAVRVAPTAPDLLVRPTVTVALENPWAVPLDRRVAIAAPGGPYERRVVLEPGERTELRRDLPRQPPGSYTVRVRANGTHLANASYRVTGDERVVAALATSGRTGSTGIGQAVQVALGNLELALGALVLLGAGMTIGAAAATYAGAVHGTKRTIGVFRAVGRTRRHVGRLVVGDALRLGSVAIVAAVALSLVALRGLDELGLLTVYGVAIPTTPSATVLAVVAGGCLLVVGAGAGLAAAALLAREPAALLDGGDQP